MAGKTTNIEVLYEDNHLILVNKPAGVLVQADPSRDVALEDLVKDYIKHEYNKPGAVFLGTSHRLDRPVSGVVLFSRTSKALERVNEMFRERTIEKTYWAVVKEVPEPLEGRLIHYLTKDEEKNKSRAFDKEVRGSQRCELTYKYLGGSNSFHLLEVKPITGRHHQIRAQLAKIGCHIKGDIKYGFARTNEDASIHLHARMLEFTHPVTKEHMRIIAQPPKDPVWNFFRESQESKSVGGNNLS